MLETEETPGKHVSGEYRTKGEELGDFHKAYLVLLRLLLGWVYDSQRARYETTSVINHYLSSYYTE